MGDGSSVVLSTAVNPRGYVRWPSNQSLSDGYDAEDVELVIVSTGGSPLPPKTQAIYFQHLKLS